MNPQVVPQAWDDDWARIAREETARIYGATVPEHHTHSVPLPEDDTCWERARLARATRDLARRK